MSRLNDIILNGVFDDFFDNKPVKSDVPEFKKGLNNVLTKEQFLERLNEYNSRLNLVSKNLPFTMKELSFFCHPNYDAENENKIELYERFEIKKSNGGVRVIHAPNSKRFKAILKIIAFVIEDAFTPHRSAYGFIKNKSFVHNSRVHLNKNYVFNTDIKDFFHSIDRKAVKFNLRSHLKGTSENMLIEYLISCISTFENENGDFVLPQGSPLSPILSNLVCFRMDEKLFNLSRRFGVNYSRYADDLSFSSDHFAFGQSFKNELKRILNQCHGFVINDKKTRLQRYFERQEVTGVTVNKKPNVSQNYIKDLRRDLYYLSRYGISVGLLIHAKRDQVISESEYSRALQFIKDCKNYTEESFQFKDSNSKKQIVWRKKVLIIWVISLIAARNDNDSENFEKLLTFNFSDNLLELEKDYQEFLKSTGADIEKSKSKINLREWNLINFTEDLFGAEQINTSSLKSKKELNIQGRLSYLQQVKGNDDSTYLKLSKKFNELFETKQDTLIELNSELLIYEYSKLLKLDRDEKVVLDAYQACFNPEKDEIHYSSIARSILNNWYFIQKSKLTDKAKQILLKVVSKSLNSGNLQRRKSVKGAHDAIETVKILSMFTNHQVYKHFTHPWDSTRRTKGDKGDLFLNSYDNFISECKAFKIEIKKLRDINYDLYEICLQFAFQFSIPEGKSYGWSKENLQLGWQYPKDLLKNLINDNLVHDSDIQPFKINFPQEFHCEIKDIHGKIKQIRTFGDVIKHFKNIIQFRNTDFTTILQRKCKTYNERIKKVKGYEIFPTDKGYKQMFRDSISSKNFFTHTEAVIEAIDIIFRLIVSREQDNVLEPRKVELYFEQIKKYNDLDYLQFKITHLGFEETIKSLENNENLRGLAGDTEVLISKLRGLCDFSYESKFIKGQKERDARINYLVQNEKFIQGEYDDQFLGKCKGFSYVLEFPI